MDNNTLAESELNAAVGAAADLAGEVDGLDLDLEEVLNAGSDAELSDEGPRTYDFNRPHNISRAFDTFKLMDKHNDMLAILDTLKFSDDRPSFHMLNVGETHYPFATPDEEPEDWPRISGIHGVFKHLDSQNVGGKLIKDEEAPKFFDQDKLDRLRERQINTVRYLNDKVFPKLYDIVPKNTFITVTADHGELFGESGYFGHGPIMHEKVFEVPFLEAQVR
jgi:arylsulfatase A-like enzyme